MVNFSIRASKFGFLERGNESVPFGDLHNVKLNNIIVLLY